MPCVSGITNHSCGAFLFPEVRKMGFGTKMKKEHPGFKAVQGDIAQEMNPKTGKPYGMGVAGAILAAKSRNASAKAKKANPRLKRVKG